MEIKKVIVGDLEENCYILVKDDDALVIDPGDDIGKIREAISDKNVVGVLVTHNHFDHIGAISYFDSSLIYCFSNLEEREYSIGKFIFDVIFTPGHSDDSVSYYFKSIDSLFCGDFIFRGSIGRCDLPTGNINKMKKSISMIKNFPKNIKIYPGHGDSSVLGYEIENNQYFNL